MNALENEIKKYKAAMAKGPRTINEDTFTDEVIRKDIVERVRKGFYPCDRKKRREILEAAAL